MKAVAEIVNLNQISQDLQGHVSQESKDSDRQSVKTIDYLFLALSNKYDHKWASLFPSDEVMEIRKLEWATSLAGILPGRLRVALDRCIHVYPEWPPTVGQFLELCKVNPEDAGLPSMYDAWMEICCEDKPFTHGVILAMVRDPKCNSYNWRLLPEERGLRLFKPIYDKYIERALDGEEFPLPTMIENKVDKPVTWEERQAHAAKHLADIKALLR